MIFVVLFVEIKFELIDVLLSSIFSIHATSSSSSFPANVYLVVSHVKKKLFMLVVTDAMFDLAMGYICTLLLLVAISAYYVV